MNDIIETIPLHVIANYLKQRGFRNAGSKWASVSIWLNQAERGPAVALVVPTVEGDPKTVQRIDRLIADLAFYDCRTENEIITAIWNSLKTEAA